MGSQEAESSLSFSIHFHSEVVVSLLLCPARLCIRDRAPQLKDEVVGEAECLKVGVVHGLGQLHCIGFALCKLPDLRRCKNLRVSAKVQKKEEPV